VSNLVRRSAAGDGYVGIELGVVIPKQGTGAPDEPVRRS
jgi:hypothetical protein